MLIELDKHVPMKVGQPLECHLLYSVYANNKLVIPAGSTMRGRVISLKSDHSRRIHARLWGDFTPYYVPVVRFDQLVLPDGTIQQIASDGTTDGALILHLSTPHAGKSHSFISREITAVKDQAKRTISLVTAPGRKDRLVQFLYRQLPDHPQRIEAATTWTISLTQPLALRPYNPSKKSEGNPPARSQSQHKHRPPSPSAANTASGDVPAWHIQAYLEHTISSATEKRGDTFQAVVAEPVFNPDHTLAVPEGSLLVGTITEAKPARSFGRTGKLRFDFRELKLPKNGPSQPVEGSLAGANTNREQQLQIDSEGGVQSKPQERVIVPLVLTILAGRVLDEDGNFEGNAAVASNGFGIIGRVAGIVVGSRDFAAGIGFYAAGLSFSERWLVRGQNVVFAKDTRIEVTAIPGPKPLPLTSPEPNASKKR